MSYNVSGRSALVSALPWSRCTAAAKAHHHFVMHVQLSPAPQTIIKTSRQINAESQALTPLPERCILQQHGIHLPQQQLTQAIATLQFTCCWRGHSCQWITCNFPRDHAAPIVSRNNVNATVTATTTAIALPRDDTARPPLRRQHPGLLRRRQPWHQTLALPLVVLPKCHGLRLLSVLLKIARSEERLTLDRYNAANIIYFLR